MAGPTGLVGRGGPGRGGGRPVGSKNKHPNQMRELAQAEMGNAFTVIAQLAGIVAVVERTKAGYPKMVAQLDANNQPVLDDAGKAVMIPKTKRLPGARSESVRLAAAALIIERAVGKAPQPIEGTEDGPPIRLNGRVALVVVEPGQPLPPIEKFDDQVIEDEEEEGDIIDVTPNKA